MTMLAQIPQHDNSVLASRSAQSTIRADSNGVNESGVTQVIDLKLGSGSLEVPDLDHLVPASGDNLRVGSIGGETDSRDPFSVTGKGSSVSTTRLSNQVTLAFTTRVPDLDGLITATGDNQAVIRGEAGRQDISSVANELANSLTRAQVPQAHSLVPGGSQGVLAVLAQSDILNGVIVTSQGALRDTVAFTITSQLPNDGSFICGREGVLGEERKKWD